LHFWLARVLLLLCHFGKEGQPEPAKISQETLAEMMGTTRSRVSFFLTLRLSNFEQTTKTRSARFRVHTARETRPMEPGKLSETILVVDNCNVRISYKDCWKLKGYTVLMATDAGTVMKVHEEYPFAVALTGAKGRLRARSKDASRGFGCVAKPFTGARLIGRIGEVLGSPPPT